MAPLVEELAVACRCLALDERAHGESGAPASGDFSWQGFAGDLLGVVDDLGLERPYGFGHSCGGSALLLAEQARPGAFRGLYCYEPVVFPPPPPGTLAQANPLVEGTRRRREVFGSRAEAYAHFAAKPPFSTLHPSVLRAYVLHGFEDLPDGGVRLRCRREHEVLIYSNGLVHDAYDHLDEVTCPVTVAYGELSDVMGADHALDLASRLPHGRVEVVGGVGHLGPLEDPRAVAASVLSAFGGEAGGEAGGDAAGSGQREPGPAGP